MPYHRKILQICGPVDFTFAIHTWSKLILGGLSPFAKSSYSRKLLVGGLLLLEISSLFLLSTILRGKLLSHLHKVPYEFSDSSCLSIPHAFHMPK